LSAGGFGVDGGDGNFKDFRAGSAGPVFQPDSGGHAGEEFDLASCGKGKPGTEGLGDGVGDLGEFAEFDGGLFSGGCGEFGGGAFEVCVSEVGGQEGFGDVDVDAEFADGWDLVDGLSGGGALVFIDGASGDNAVEGRFEGGVCDLEFGFQDSAF